jgi:hypothetical protein
MPREMHRTSVKVPLNLWIHSQKRGIRATQAMKFGLSALSFLTAEEIHELFEIIEERQQKDDNLQGRLDKIAPKIEERAPADRKHILISLYREYKQTLEFPVQSIQTVAEQNGIEAEVLSNDLKQLIWGEI